MSRHARGISSISQWFLMSLFFISFKSLSTLFLVKGALQSIANIIMATIRASDIPVRIGGEEFAVFVPGKDYKNAGLIAERVRAEISRLKMGPPMENQVFNISAGVAFRHVK
jgi:GGDEF domain-containing protein